MRRIRFLFPLLILLGILFVSLSGLISSQKTVQSPQALTPWSAPSTAPAVVSSATISPAAISSLPIGAIAYEVHDLPQSTVHVLRIAANTPLRVTPALAVAVDSLENFAGAAGVIAAVNGGFFDPVNQKTTSYVVLNGAIAADPAENERLVNNPDLMPYLDRILERSEFRQYQCGQAVHYSIVAHSQSVPPDCQLLSALGAGPQLLPELALVEEGFVERAEGKKVRDALGSDQPNARTAVGITNSGDVVLIMAAQLPELPAASGLSLPELADFMQAIGVETALNLDGGSSSGLYYQGQTYYGKVDINGDRVERPVKSALLVQSFAE